MPSRYKDYNEKIAKLSSNGHAKDFEKVSKLTVLLTTC